jgi:hypothetical protein
MTDTPPHNAPLLAPRCPRKRFQLEKVSRWLHPLGYSLLLGRLLIDCRQTAANWVAIAGMLNGIKGLDALHYVAGGVGAHLHLHVIQCAMEGEWVVSIDPAL